MVSTPKSKPKKKIAKTSSKSELSKALTSAKKSMKKNLNKRNKALLTDIAERFKAGQDSKSLYYGHGKYTPERRKLHNKIISDILKQDRPTKNPDLYIFGGIGGSGKSSLNKYIKEKAVTLNNDDIKSALAKHTPSPSRRYFLLHAALLHREAQDIESRTLEKLLKSKKDVILDRTLSNYDKSLAIVKRFQKRGYDITTLGTSLKPSVAISRSTKRFLKGKEGRYVPVKIIAKKGNQTNKNVVRMAKKKFNKQAVIVDTFRRKGKVIYSKGVKTKK